ncbi:4-hydroxy-tetrahydrodipicolinate synthase [Calorimonas adulescens]|uniref:4-hydroxy-tetrahydrodipicolinate synthase n=1 Tax=Calorimonas adulescens TaxID=2606906 RepID=A0A5D8QCC9_9THEO|nr:4-hydroxy-tetrahydrodipicolinate synthase [Calorimonas adulescens]TZE81754.1 4-hydroxy-tetrahydrodipicolinate synthase [Calorimonas adulescens]
MAVFKGSGVALVTPFTKDGVNFEVLDKLLDFHLKNSTDAIIACGTTGEASTMTDEEKNEVIKYTVNKINKKIPVIAGTGSNDTRHSIEMSIEAERLGADALLVITPYYNKTTQRGLIEHFTKIADSVHIPIIIYNVPGRTGLNIMPQTLAELKKHPNIVGVKEASGDISQIAEVARLCGEDFAIYSGNDDQVVPIMALGGLGVISVTANILPKDVHDMAVSFLEGNIKKSKDLQLKLNPLNKSLFIEVNPIPIKTAMNLIGMNVGPLRLPLTTMEPKNLEILKSRLTEYGFTVS